MAGEERRGDISSQEYFYTEVKTCLDGGCSEMFAAGGEDAWADGNKSVFPVIGSLRLKGN